jgi:hypothetical protein
MTLISGADSIKVYTVSSIESYTVRFFLDKHVTIPSVGYLTG